jgi:hypothetical protein
MRSQIKALKKLWPELVRVMLYDLLLGRGKIQARHCRRHDPNRYHGRDRFSADETDLPYRVAAESRRSCSSTRTFSRNPSADLRHVGKSLATSLLGALAVALLSATRIEQLEEEPGRCNA